MFVVNKNPTSTDLRKFGWAMLLGFGVLGVAFWVLTWWRGGDTASLGWTGSRGQMVALGLLGVGTVLWAIVMMSESTARPVYIAWMSVAVPVGLVMSTVLLTVLYFVFLPVFSLVVRAGDPLRKRLHRDGSYWEDYKPHEPTMDRMARPF